MQKYQWLYNKSEIYYFIQEQYLKQLSNLEDLSWNIQCIYWPRNVIGPSVGWAYPRESDLADLSQDPEIQNFYKSPKWIILYSGNLLWETLIKENEF